MKKIIAVAIVMAVIITSCEKDKGLWYSKKWETEHPNGQSSGPPKVCDTSSVISFSTTIQPIINQNCGTSNGSCHKSHGGAGASDYNQFTNIQNDALAGTFMQRIDLPSTDALHMPQNNLTTLDPCDTMKIRKWIHAGALNN
jgi:hypothetical protein